MLPAVFLIHGSANVFAHNPKPALRLPAENTLHAGLPVMRCLGTKQAIENLNGGNPLCRHSLSKHESTVCVKVAGLE